MSLEYEPASEPLHIKQPVALHLPNLSRTGPRVTTLEATQGQIDGFFSQLPYKCLSRTGPRVSSSSPRLGLCYRLGGDTVSDLSANYRLGGDRTGKDNSPQGSLRVYPRTLL